MDNIIDYQSSKKLINPLYIDVRSPSEYLNDRIESSINLPVLNDQERKEVGTLYKRGLITEAKLLGVQAMSVRLPDYFKQIQELIQQGHSLIFYCRSGGYRSSSIFQLLRAMGEEVYQLKGGYKTYRHYVLEQLEILPQQFEFISLDGMTGTGKTHILDQLEIMGQQIIDLEGLANHRGSHFGSIGLGQQPSQTYFESRLVALMETFQPGPVFIEGESASIGKIHLPLTFYQVFKDTPHHVLIESSMDHRVDRILRDYLQADNRENIEATKTAILAMNKLSDERKNKYIEWLDQGNASLVVEEMIRIYYDAHYTLKNKDFEYRLDNQNSEHTAQKILSLYRDLLS